MFSAKTQKQSPEINFRAFVYLIEFILLFDI